MKIREFELHAAAMRKLRAEFKKSPPLARREQRKDGLRRLIEAQHWAFRALDAFESALSSRDSQSADAAKAEHERALNKIMAAEDAYQSYLR